MTKLTILVVQAEDLLAKDRSWTTQQRTSSDPYAQVFVDGQLIGKTRTIKRNCSPTWYDCLEYELPPSVDEASKILLRLWDADVSSKDDFLGCVHVPLAATKEAKWFPVEAGDHMDILHHCKKAKGRVLLEISLHED